MFWLILLVVFIAWGAFILWVNSDRCPPNLQQYRYKSPKTRKAEKYADIDRLAADYDLDELHVSRKDGSAIGLSFDAGQIILGSISSVRQFPFSKIMSVEILSGDVSISKTNRGSQLAGAAIGGLVFGGLGALAGGLTASKRSNDRIGNLSLKVAVNDREDPFYLISLFDAGSKKGVEQKSTKGRAATMLAERWRAHLINAMDGDMEVGAEAVNKPDNRYNVEIVEPSVDRMAAIEALNTMVKSMEAARIINGSLPKIISKGVSRKEACILKSRLSYGGFRARISSI